MCHLDTGRDDGRLVRVDSELVAAECRPARHLQSKMLLDKWHSWEADPVGRGTGAKYEIDALEPQIASADLESLRLGADIEPERSKLVDKRLPEFLRTVGMDQRKIVQRSQIGSTEHFGGLCEDDDTRAVGGHDKLSQILAQWLQRAAMAMLVTKKGDASRRKTSPLHATT